MPSRFLFAELEAELRKYERWIVVGVGNPWREDDGVGSLLAKRLLQRFPKRVLDAEDAPETLGEAVEGLRPDAVLIVDAAWMGNPPGTTELIPLGDVPLGLSTHRIPIPLVAELWRQDSGATPILLGIQPARMGHERGLSPEVEQALEQLACFLAGLLG